MSDTATQETEATEAPVEKVQRDWPAELSAVFVNASKQFDAAAESLSDDAVKAVQEKFREIPAAARGTAQAAALKAVLTQGNADGLEAVLDALNSMPKPGAAKGTGRGRKPKVEVDPVEAGSIQAAALLVAWAKLGEDPEHGEAITARAQAYFQNEVEISDDLREQFLDLAERAVKAVSKARGGGGGGGGTRSSFKETLADLIGDGRIKSTPAKITMSGGKGEPEIEAKILKSGKVKIGDREFDNLSAAAKFAKDPAKYDDKTSKVSLNGWDAWQIANPDGEGTVAVGTLRKA